MAVNLSARQLVAPDIVGDVANALVRSGFGAASLILEMTESVLVQDAETATRRLAGAARPRRSPGDRRLRHRLLVAQLPPPVPHRHLEDRQVVHRHHHRPNADPTDRPRPARSGEDPGDDVRSPKGSSTRCNATAFAISTASSAKASCSPSRSKPTMPSELLTQRDTIRNRAGRALIMTAAISRTSTIPASSALRRFRATSSGRTGSSASRRRAGRWRPRAVDRG